MMSHVDEPRKFFTANVKAIVEYTVTVELPAGSSYADVKSFVAEEHDIQESAIEGDVISMHHEVSKIKQKYEK